jgi:hypothetical protein
MLMLQRSNSYHPGNEVGRVLPLSCAWGKPIPCAVRSMSARALTSVTEEQVTEAGL